MKKRGFFLTTDAFIAIAILVFGVILFISTISHEPYRPQSIFFAHDIVEAIGNTKMYEINNIHGDSNIEYLKKYRNSGEIENFQNTVMGQNLEFIYRQEEHDCNNCLEMARNMTEGIVKDLVADKYSINISISVEELGGQNFVIYSRVHQSDNGASFVMGNSSFVFSNKQLIIQQINDTYVAIGLGEVTVWQ